MKKVTKIIMVAYWAGVCGLGYAQDCWTCKPEPYEKIIGSISIKFSSTFYEGSDKQHYYSGYSSQEIYNKLYNKAIQEYPYYSNLKIRNGNISRSENTDWDNLKRTYYYNGTFSVVQEDPRAKTNLMASSKLDQSVDKATSNIPSDARIAIDKVTTSDESSSDAIKDHLLDILIDKGYHVVAKEYLEKLYKEQQDQQSGIYNERTTVQENNFSAVGYFINVKVTETSIRVQVVNVSTGEYEGNAMVNF